MSYCFGSLLGSILIADARRRVGVLGGTFDPIHVGHLSAARCVVEQLSLDELLIVPAGQPWQKGGRTFASAPDRLTMARLSVHDDPKLIVSDVDVRRPGPTYTVDTMVDIRREEPPAQWWFVVGADSFARVPTWHEAKRLGGLARFAVAPRVGFDESTIFDVCEQMKSLGSELEVDLIDMPLIDVSSSRIREAAARGESISEWVAEPVAQYVATRALYRDSASVSSP